jgi:putative ABC transport system substrate-binding protein
MTSRRAFIAGSLALRTAPLAVEAQAAGKVYRIGFLCSVHCTPRALAAFRDSLRELQYREGQDLVIEYRREDANWDRQVDLARELVGLKVDVIVAPSDTLTVATVREARSIPVVAVMASPEAHGTRVATLARPGGNVTGLSLMFTELIAKRLELLRGIRPGLSRVGVLWRRGYVWRGAPQAAAQALGLTVRLFEALDAGELNDQFAAMKRDGIEALLVGPHELFRVYHSRVLTLALAQRLPVMYDSREAAEDGGLISYGPDMTEVFRRAAVYVDKILKGAKPGDLPIEQPTMVELVINLKTAKALGLTIPPAVLARADQVIQ